MLTGTLRLSAAPCVSGAHNDWKGQRRPPSPRAVTSRAQQVCRTGASFWRETYCMRHSEPCSPPGARGPRATPYTLCTADERVTVTVYPGPPAYVYVTHDGVSEGEVDALLLELAWSIPSPCCVVMLPQWIGHR